MNLLGIKRAAVFSPNMTDNDDAIVNAVVEELRLQGHCVELLTEEEWSQMETADLTFRPDRIFTMMRSHAALQALEKVERQGILAVNPSEGIRNAERLKITQLQLQNNIPIPRTVFINHKMLPDIPCPCWIKRGSGWTTSHHDVRFADNKEEALRIINEMRQQHPQETLVVAQHRTGDLLKFYGVEGTQFFFAYYPDPDKTKFQLEKHNGRPQYFHFDEQMLKAVCNRLAKAANLPIYGGDAIIEENGSFCIIDFNDWPSFSPCRKRASMAIAKKILIPNS